MGNMMRLNANEDEEEDEYDYIDIDQLPDDQHYLLEDDCD